MSEVKVQIKKIGKLRKRSETKNKNKTLARCNKKKKREENYDSY